MIGPMVEDAAVIAALMAALALVSYVPAVTLWLPNVLLN
jgi:TRAP-type C4-dicarboxylate transport system permease large subunit